MFLGFVFLLLGSALFAEHARVMPARVGRLYMVPTFIHFDQMFTEGGSRTGADVPPTAMFNLGFALEYGITPWITGAAQWTPGINLWSDVDGVAAPLAVTPSGSGVISGMGDLFLGAKIQIIGPAAPITSETIRLAFGPGLKIPLSSPDFAGELGSNTPNVARLDNHVLGIGLRSYLDFIINEFFYINLYNEFLFYPMRGKVRDLGLAHAAGVVALGLPNANVNFGYDLTFELEPNFTYRLADPNIAFEVGLPFIYYFTPGYTISGNHPHPLMQDEGSVHRFSIGPNVSAFFLDWPMPMEFLLAYQIPVMGRNTPVRHVVSLQVRAYFRI